MIYWFIFEGYTGEGLIKLLCQVDKGEIVNLDRWHIEFSAPEAGEEADPIPCNIINNYFSIGVVGHFLCGTKYIHTFFFKIKGRRDCPKISHDARETSGKVQQSHEEQVVVL